MSRYINSKTKLSKRVHKNLYLKGSRSFSAKDDYTKKVQRSRQKRTFSKPLSEYGKQLLEKQSLRFTYGLTEKQLNNLFRKALRKDGDTGFLALTNLEMRLDNIVYRGGFSNSRSQARQLVNHGHFLVNGNKVDIPSFVVSKGDIIEIKENKKNKVFWKNFQLQVPGDVPKWLESDKKTKIKVVNLPLVEDLPEDFNISSIVEYYARKAN